MGRLQHDHQELQARSRHGQATNHSDRTSRAVLLNVDRSRGDEDAGLERFSSSNETRRAWYARCQVPRNREERLRASFARGKRKAASPRACVLPNSQFSTLRLHATGSSESRQQFRFVRPLPVAQDEYSAPGLQGRRWTNLNYTGRPKTVDKQVISNDRSGLPRSTQADPMRPAAVFSASDRSTSKLEVRSHRRESRRGDTCRSNVASIYRKKIPAERLHPNTVHSHC